MNWHTLTIEETLERLESRDDGLTSAQARERLARYGPNELTQAEGISAWMILLDQFRSVLVIILLIATAISGIVGHPLEAIAILVIVLFAVVLGFIQEYRAERAIESLQKMTAPTAIVLRDSEDVDLPAGEIVPGDIILLSAGDRIPADARILEEFSLSADEAPLTGESAPVDKQSAQIADPDLAVSDRRNMVWAGTITTRGRGRAVVVATGMETEFGRIAGMLESVETVRTPLQETLDHVGWMLGRAAIAVVVVIVGLGLYRGQPFIDMLLFGIALAVAVVPEALPAVVTISLALGVTRMAKRNVLVRRLPAVETLGSTSVICTDKTGTLTRDEMTVRRIELPDESWEVSGSGFDPHGVFTIGGNEREPSETLLGLLETAALASDARLVRDSGDGHWHIKGDPTEGALIVVAAKAGIRKSRLDDQMPREDEIGFTSERKRMTTLHRQGSSCVACAKGAPEMILESCDREKTGDGVIPLEESSRERIAEQAREMAENALRVLAIARKPETSIESSERNMVFLGLVGMIDPPREEAPSAIETCHRAGIDVVMITGDHPVTAAAVAREVGIASVERRTVTGLDLDRMDQDELERAVEEIAVYARVSPAHKLRIVRALQKKGHITAMTGDGVNDGPPLKQADIGIAMGITGTDVSKEAAAMTLTDDNFASIVGAVEEGRGIFGNIEKYLMYLLSSNIGEIGLMAGAALAGLPMPLTALQILYVNLATDGLPALALSVDPPEDDLMERPPRDPRGGIFTRPVLSLMLAGGIWSSIVNLGIFVWALQSERSLQEAMTMAFVSLVLIQFFKAYNFRSPHHSILQRPFANRWLNLAIAWEIVLLALILYLPILSEIFETYQLTTRDWTIIVGAAFSVCPVLEAVKWSQRGAQAAGIANKPERA